MASPQVQTFMDYFNCLVPVRELGYLVISSLHNQLKYIFHLVAVAMTFVNHRIQSQIDLISDKEDQVDILFQGLLQPVAY